MMMPCNAEHGQSRQSTLNVALQEFENAHRAAGDDQLASAAAQTRLGMLRNPCDVVHKPATMMDAIHRVEGCIPPVTPFATLEKARRDLQRAREQLIALDIAQESE